jgi:hypothetical protein
MLKNAWMEEGAARPRSRPLTPPRRLLREGKQEGCVVLRTAPYRVLASALTKGAGEGEPDSAHPREPEVRRALTRLQGGSQISVVCAPLPLAEGPRNQLFAPLSRLPGEGPRRGGEGLFERTHRPLSLPPFSSFLTALPRSAEADFIGEVI